MTYARQAGERAFAMFAWRDAARYYEAAVSASESVATATAQDRADLLYQAGLSHYRHQDIEPARGYFERAVRAYREIGDVYGLANTLILLTSMSFTHTSLPMDVMANLQPLHEVFEALGDTDPSLSTYVIVVISQAYRVTRQSDKADEFAQKAFEMGHRANNDFVCSAALNALGLACLGRLQFDEAIQSWQESARYARRIDDPFQYSAPLLNLPLALNLKGMLGEAEAQALEAGEIARLIQDWSGYSKALSHLASVSTIMYPVIWTAN